MWWKGKHLQKRWYKKALPAQVHSYHHRSSLLFNFVLQHVSPLFRHFHLCHSVQGKKSEVPFRTQNVCREWMGTGPSTCLSCYNTTTKAQYSSNFVQHFKYSDTTSSVDITKFLGGPDSNTHFQKSEHSLVRDFGYSISLAQTWSALGALRVIVTLRGQDMQLPPAIPNIPIPNLMARILMFQWLLNSTVAASLGLRGEGRVKNHLNQPSPSECVPSGTIQVASSSPRAPSSSDASSAGYIEKEEHQLRGTVEDETVRLASCVIRHILYFGAPQDQPNMSSVVEFRDIKLRTRTVLRGISSITAIDDGGLCSRDENNAKEFILQNDHVAILEAKRKFQCFEEGKPIISDACLAQMTCEALLARFVDVQRETVIVIHATQHYLRFLQFEISDEYVKDFGLDSLDSFIPVVATPWYDLSNESNRKEVVLNLCAIMRRG